MFDISLETKCSEIMEGDRKRRRIENEGTSNRREQGDQVAEELDDPGIQIRVFKFKLYQNKGKTFTMGVKVFPRFGLQNSIRLKGISNDNISTESFLNTSHHAAEDSQRTLMLDEMHPQSPGPAGRGRHLGKQDSMPASPSVT